MKLIKIQVNESKTKLKWREEKCVSNNNIIFSLWSMCGIQRVYHGTGNTLISCLSSSKRSLYSGCSRTKIETVPRFTPIAAPKSWRLGKYVYGTFFSSQTAGKWHMISIGDTSPANKTILKTENRFEFHCYPRQRPIKSNGIAAYPVSPFFNRLCTSFKPFRKNVFCFDAAART